MSPSKVSAALFCALVAVGACNKDKGDKASENMPVAADWNGGRAVAPAQPTAADPHAGLGMGGPGDPHAGLDMGGASDPHAGLDMGGAGDPHAGLDMGGAGDPHAGLDMGGSMGGGGDPEMAGLQAPDPNRAIDESKFVKGQIVTTKDTAGLVKPGAIVFLSVKPVNKATGDIIGPTLAVERLDVQAMPIDFRLSEANSMIAGTVFEGDVIISARVDADGEARTRTPGDVEGTVMATIPAEGLTLTLDHIIIN